MGRNTSSLIPAFRSRILLRVCLMNNREAADYNVDQQDKELFCNSCSKNNSLTLNIF